MREEKAKYQNELKQRVTEADLWRLYRDERLSKPLICATLNLNESDLDYLLKEYKIPINRERLIIKLAPNVRTKIHQEIESKLDKILKETEISKQIEREVRLPHDCLADRVFMVKYSGPFGGPYYLLFEIKPLLEISNGVGQLLRYRNNLGRRKKITMQNIIPILVSENVPGLWTSALEDNVVKVLDVSSEEDCTRKLSKIVSKCLTTEPLCLVSIPKILEIEKAIDLLKENVQKLKDVKVPHV
jgi:hypothetical protein